MYKQPEEWQEVEIQKLIIAEIFSEKKLFSEKYKIA